MLKPLHAGLFFSLVTTASVAASAEPAASAESPAEVTPQISYSVAVGRSQESALGHMWLGAGAHFRGGGFALGGAEFDFTDPGTEIWSVMRVGVGSFKEGAWAPYAAVYMLGGRLLHRGSRGNEKAALASSNSGVLFAPRWRLGVGASVPALIELACIGIPTMAEAGVDLGSGRENSRAFVRLGWNF